MNFCKRYFTNKGICNDEKIILVEKEEVLRKDSRISDTFNNYFVNITDELGIYKWGNIPQNSLDSTEKIKYFSDHPSIKTIKDKLRNSFNFKFKFVSTEIVLTCINETNIKKNSSGEISPAIIKLAKKEILIAITNCINKCISIKSFPDDLKVADVIPVFKKEDPNNKANYRSINLLPIISKIFERVLFEQIEKFSEKILSLKSCGFRKGYSTRHALLNLLKNWQKTSDKSGVLGAALMDLSKVYDCLPHDLLIAKSSAYGFEDSATSLISDYLSKRYQRVKIGSAFSSYLEILRVVPQGSILGLIRLNIFINDLIFFIQEIEVYNFTMYSSSLNYKEAAHKLSNDTYIVLNWLRVNSMVANPGKFQIMFLGSKIDNSKITFAIENK